MLLVCRLPTLRTVLMLLGLGGLWSLVLLFGFQSSPLSAQERGSLLPPPVRIGVVAFEDFEGEFQRWNRLFAELPKEDESTLTFELAVGTYGDLLHWMDKGYVDIAVLTPGVFAEYFQLGKKEHSASREGRFEYLATDGVPATSSSWATDEHARLVFIFVIIAFVWWQRIRR